MIKMLQNALLGVVLGILFGLFFGLIITAIANLVDCGAFVCKKAVPTQMGAFLGMGAGAIIGAIMGSLQNLRK